MNKLSQKTVQCLAEMSTMMEINFTIEMTWISQEKEKEKGSTDHIYAY